jgi:hypothetical protein
MYQGTLKERKTPGQLRRRAARLERRAGQRLAFVQSPARPRAVRSRWVSYAVERTNARIAQALSAAFIAKVVARIHGARARRNERCPHVRVTLERHFVRGPLVETYSDPCGGVLKRAKVATDVYVRRCQTCGRDYQTDKLIAAAA